MLVGIYGRVFLDNLLRIFIPEGHVIYSAFTKYLQGKACIAWDEHLAEEYPNDVDQTTEEFDVALTCYLEKISCIENLNDNLLLTTREDLSRQPPNMIQI